MKARQKKKLIKKLLENAEILKSYSKDRYAFPGRKIMKIIIDINKTPKRAEL